MVCQMRFLSLLLICICLGGCKIEFPKLGIPVDFDEIRIRNVTYSADSTIDVDFRVTAHDFFLGAPVKTGAPFKANLCVDNGSTPLPIISNIKMFRSVSGRKSDITYKKDILDKNWFSKGAFSCIFDVIEFHEQIDDKIEVQVEVFFKFDGDEKMESHEFSFTRQKIEKLLTLEAFLNQ